MIVFSRVSLSFSTSFKKTDKTYYSFAAKERRKNCSNNRDRSLLERIYFFQGKKSYQNMSDFTFSLRYISAMFFNYERNIYYLYIYSYLNT